MNRTDVERRLADRDGVLLATDFDGTLAAITERPSDATPVAGVERVLSSLSGAPSAHVGVVSGRALDDLRERVDVAGATLVGNHGLEAYHDGARRAFHDDGVPDAVGRAADALAARFDGVDGVTVEEKRLTLAVHHRRATGVDGDDVAATVERTLSALDAPLSATRGRQVVEVRPRSSRDKGAAVEWLYRQVVPADESWLAVYAGDDRSDEPAMRAVEARDGVSIGVAGGPDLDATCRVDGPAAVRDAIAAIRDAVAERA